VRRDRAMEAALNQKRPHSSLGYGPPAPVTFREIQSLELQTAMQ
jgi:hypothetical protein